MSHKPYTIWITGLSAAGKTTLGQGLSEHLRGHGVACEWLDGEEIRKGLDREYGYSAEERTLVVERIGDMATAVMAQGKVAIISTISHIYAARLAVREQIGDFFEIYLRCPPEVCATRDYKGNYDKAMRGELDNFIGVTEPYEETPNPELVIDTSAMGQPEALARAIEALDRASALRTEPV